MQRFNEMDLKNEHYRAYVFLEMKRGRAATDVYQQLLDTHLSNVPSRATIFRWWKDFSDGSRTSLCDQPRIGRPSTATTEENVAFVKHSLDENPRQSLRMLADLVGCNKDTIRDIVTNILGLKKLCSVWIPHILSDINKKDRVECATEIIRIQDQNSMDDCLRYWTTEDETWVLFDELQTKQDNKAWLAPNAARPRVILPKLTNKKTLLLLAFTGDGKCNIEAFRRGQTVTAKEYVSFVHRTGEKWRTLRSSPTRLNQLWWQHDNARPHAAAATKQFFARRQVTLIRQSAYSPDFNLADRWMFLYLKKNLKKNSFKSPEEVRAESLRLFRSIQRERFVHELERLYAYCKDVIRANGDYVV